MRPAPDLRAARIEAERAWRSIGDLPPPPGKLPDPPPKEKVSPVNGGIHPLLEDAIKEMATAIITG